MSLNVISALARLGVDPWEETTRLADLPKAVAAEALARLVAVAYRSTAAFGQPGHQPAIGRAFTATQRSEYAAARAGWRDGEEIF